MAVVQSGKSIDTKTGMWLGIRDCFKHWFLILRCSWIGAALGAMPGIGVAVIDWIAYGHALRTEKGAAETFGKGDVRGVIAAESSTNAREGGALVPTVAFGVPSSAGMAILLGAFLIQGLVPGPDMLTKNLDVTYSMVWSIAIANILGSGLCFIFSGQLAKLATLRYTLIMPCVLSLIYIGAFEHSRNWGDLYSLLFFGMLGWGMKHFKWPRPPLVLGFILGGILERYMFISIERYGTGWLWRPVVVVMFVMSGLTLLRPVIQDIKEHHGIKAMLTNFGAPRFSGNNIFAGSLLIIFIVMLAMSLPWPFEAKIIPTIVGTAAVIACGLSLLNDIFGQHHSVIGVEAAAAVANASGGEAKPVVASQKIHMDVESKDRPSAPAHHPDPRTSVLRLDGGVPRQHGGDRAHPDGSDLRDRLHAARRAGKVEARGDHGRDHGDADLRRVRSASHHPVAADDPRHVLPGVQDHSERVSLGGVTPRGRQGCTARRSWFCSA